MCIIPAQTCLAEEELRVMAVIWTGHLDGSSQSGWVTDDRLFYIHMCAAITARAELYVYIYMCAISYRAHIHVMT